MTTREPDKLLPPRGLTDGVVAIRPLLAADAPAYARAFVDDPQLGVLLGSETDPTTEEVVAQTTQERPPGHPPPLAIADVDSLGFIGSIGVYRIDTHHRRGEIGFWLVPGARGRGLGTRAVRLVTGWAFEALGFERVEITTTPDNEPTLRLARALGFVEEGVMRKRNLERGKRVDVVMLSLLVDEWEA